MSPLWPSPARPDAPALSVRTLLLTFGLALVPALAPAQGLQPVDAPWTLVAPNKGWWKEVQVPLGRAVWLGAFGGPGIWLTLTDDTNVGFRARVDSGAALWVAKRKGLASQDPRAVLTSIYAYGDHPVFYVDDLKAAHGYAKLRLEAP